MEPKRMIELTVGIVVGLVVFSAILMPVVNNATTTEHTFTNEGMWRMKEIENGDVWTFTNSPATWVCNDVTQTGIYGSGYNGMLGDEWLVRSNGQARGPAISGNATSLTATADEINISFTGVSGTLTYPLSGYGIDQSGDYILSDYSKPTYVLGDSEIYGTGVSEIDGIGCTVHVEASINDGATFTLMNNRNQSVISDAVFSNVTINYEPVEGYVNLYIVSSITADVTFNNTVEGTTTEHTGSVTYSSYVVPYKVTAELSNHLDSDMIQIIGVIPILIIAGLIVGIAATVVSRRE